MAEQCYVGVDLGAESGRVIVGRFDGRTIELDPLHRFANGPVQVADTLRWNVLGLWSEIQNGLAKSATQYGGKIASVGVDTWGVDYALFDKAGDDEALFRDAVFRRDPVQRPGIHLPDDQKLVARLQVWRQHSSWRVQAMASPYLRKMIVQAVCCATAFLISS